MNRFLEELMHELFWMGERRNTPPDLARVVERLRAEWRAGSFEEPLFQDDDTEGATDPVAHAVPPSAMPRSGARARQIMAMIS